MKRTLPFLLSLVRQGSLVKQIIVALILGIAVGVLWPSGASSLDRKSVV